jgi:hypothetical protein
MPSALALRMSLRASLLGLLLVTCGSLAACGIDVPATDTLPPNPGPGAGALADDDPTCASDKECETGERCVDGVCQLQRCGTQPYTSIPPLGKTSLFGSDRELVVLPQDGLALVGLEPVGRAFTARPDLRLGYVGAKVVDASPARLIGGRGESMVALLDSGSSLVVTSSGARTFVGTGILPIAVDTADLDGDGEDEAVAVDKIGNLVVCTLGAARACRKTYLGNLETVDVALADLQGKGVPQAVVLATVNGKSKLLVVDVAGAKVAIARQIDTTHTLLRLASGNIDGANGEELIGLEDSGLGGFVGDTAYTYGMKNGALEELAKTSLPGDTIDIAVGDLDGDNKSDVLVLSGGGLTADVRTAKPDFSLGSVYTSQLPASARATRLFVADIDGDSPTGTLVGAPSLVPGPVVPMAVLVHPPYSRTFSSGSPQVVLGNRESRSEVTDSTVSLKASVAVGFEAEFPAVAKAVVMTKVEVQIERTRASNRTISVGDRFALDARPELEGPDNGAVVLACACYHAYSYKVDDPAGKLAKPSMGKLMSLFVPVGGQTSLWSVKRYNALAAKTKLPMVRVPFLIGDPSSYPSTPSTLSGKPIAPEDMLFSTPRPYRTSDVASVGWSLDVSASESERESKQIGVSVRGQVKAGAVIVEGEVGVGAKQGYTLTVGKETSFSGMVPPVRDDPRTPEDEHVLHSYSFSPIVYREHYKQDGAEGGFFVVSYTTSK